MTIFVSLYTSRVVLDVLGVDDYGVYNVVGGIVVILSFLNGTMSGATSRFISYELGVGDPERLRKTFSAALSVHAYIALIIFVLAETVGLWYVNNELVIAPERLAAANWVFQYSVFAAILSVFQIPYVAAIMAHERMGYYAWVAIANVLLKLVAILVVLWVAIADNLSTYAAMIFIGAAIVAGMYIIYARRNFAECRWERNNDRSIVKSLIKFCTSDIYGNLCFTTRFQGVVVILNRFGGTALNAAGGLCNTVSATISSFAGSVTTAFRPQIIQQYARGEYDYMVKLMINCSRYSLILMGLIIIPLIIAMQPLLELWLVEPPRYTAIFCQLALVAVCGEVLHTIIGAGIHATGRILRYSAISGTLFILELPIMWVLLKITDNPPIVYCVHITMIAVIVITDLLLLRLNFSAFPPLRFALRGIIVPLLILVAVFIPTYLITVNWHFDLLHIFLMAIISTLLLALLTLLFILDPSQRRSLLQKLLRIRNKE